MTRHTWVPVNSPCTLCLEYIAGVGYTETFEHFNDNIDTNLTTGLDVTL